MILHDQTNVSISSKTSPLLNHSIQTRDDNDTAETNIEFCESDSGIQYTSEYLNTKFHPNMPATLLSDNLRLFWDDRKVFLFSLALIPAMFALQFLLQVSNDVVL